MYQSSPRRRREGEGTERFALSAEDEESRSNPRSETVDNG